MDDHQVIYEEWCKHARYYFWECKSYNAWRYRAKIYLTMNIIPRIGVLSTQSYMGCGYHYSLEQSAGKLLTSLAVPINITASHCEKTRDHLAEMMINRVVMESLVDQVVKAERSIQRV